MSKNICLEKGSNTNSPFKNEANDTKYFSLALDGLKDVTNTAQLIIQKTSAKTDGQARPTQPGLSAGSPMLREPLGPRPTQVACHPRNDRISPLHGLCGKTTSKNNFS